MSNYRSSIIVLAILSVSSCDQTDFLDGYDRQALFTRPTASEVDAVRSDWLSRDLSSNGYSVEQSVEVTSNGTTLKIVSFNVDGYKEYGALLIPASEVALPVRMFIGGFGKDITVNSINLVIDDNTLTPFIFAIPALRGQSLSVIVNDVAYTSPVSQGDHCDAFDGATDDTIAFLNVIEDTEGKADTHRVAVRGGSRGGTVALLVAERDKRVKLAVGVAGPTDMVERTSNNENDQTYQCQFLEEIVTGSGTISDVRHKMIASSPIFFASDLPDTQVHFAANDNIVPVSQGDALRDEMSSLGIVGRLEMYIYEGRDHSDIANNNTELNERIEDFLSQL